MSDEQLAQYYANLLILQYRGKPKAYATIRALALAGIMNQLPLAIQEAYDPDTAVGVQLDVIGKYVGVARMGYGTNGPITLGDEDYRKLIRLVIIKNNSGSSLATIQQLLAANFPGEIFITDSQTMQLNYVIVESIGTSDLLELLATGGYLPRPMGVNIAITFVPDHQNPFFGFVSYEDPDPTGTSPFNNYEFYQLTYPWLTY